MMADDRFTLALQARIRRCTAADLGALEWYGLFTAHREIIRGAFEAQERGDGLMLLVDVNGFPAGQLWVDLARGRDRGTAVLWAVRVFPPLRSLGLGGRLLQAAERVLRDREYGWAELGVERSNIAARRLYARTGYVVAGEERGWFTFTPPGATSAVRQRRDELIMRKRLRDAV
jgi:ribosomal protein S18 acetylase RimI-like enzyme